MEAHSTRHPIASRGDPACFVGGSSESASVAPFVDASVFMTESSFFFDRVPKPPPGRSGTQPIGALHARFCKRNTGSEIGSDSDQSSAYSEARLFSCQLSAV